MKQNELIHHFESVILENEETFFLFPDINSSFAETMELMKKCYDKEKHSQLLANYCFRCHEPSIITEYNKFRCEYHPELKEPLISKFYLNKAFVDLQ